MHIALLALLVCPDCQSALTLDPGATISGGQVDSGTMCCASDHQFQIAGRVPRFVQHAIWRFCAEAGLNRCNGRRIADRAPCQQADCPVFAGCGRVPLKPA